MPKLNKKDQNLNIKKRVSKPKGSPVGEYHHIQNTLVQNQDPGYINRLLIGTATTGVVRMEWVMARYGQVIPTNWSMVMMNQFLSSYVPVEYLVADAQNLIVREAITKEFEWLFLLEHDVVLPSTAFLQLNEHIRSEKNPVVSGLYFTKTIPAEPMIYRGRGNSFYTNWKLKDEVWADGVPTGCLLIHVGLLKAMWDESPEYQTKDGQITRRVFETPAEMWFNPETGQFNTKHGTSDLEWCTRIIEGKYLEKSGWKKHQKKKYPFLVDTNIFCHQIDEEGVRYP